jgi:hypothetical protein
MCQAVQSCHTLEKRERTTERTHSSLEVQREDTAERIGRNPRMKYIRWTTSSGTFFDFVGSIVLTFPFILAVATARSN